MPWYKSFEQVSKLLILGAGLILLFMGETEIGMALLGSSGALVIAGAADKKRKDGKGGSSVPMILFLAGILCLGSMGCGMLQELPGEVIDLNLSVYDVHDDYVLKDSDLDEFDRQQLLRSTAILREIMRLLKSGATSLELMIMEKPAPVE